MHTPRVSMQAVEDMFGECIISCDLCSLRLPDLTDPEFYLQVKLNTSVIGNNHLTIADLQRNISVGIRNVQPNETVHVFSNIQP